MPDTARLAIPELVGTNSADFAAINAALEQIDAVAALDSQTVDQGLAAPADTGPITSVLSWIVGLIKAITGAADWKTAPAYTLAKVKAILDGTDATKIPAAALAANAATDTVIGNRTGDPALAGPASTGTLTQLFGWIMGRIKAITGGTNWFDAPATTLAAAATGLANAASHIANMANPHATTAAQAGAIPNSGGSVSNWNLAGGITYDRLAGNIQNSQLAGGITGDKVNMKLQAGNVYISIPGGGTGSVSVTFSPAFPSTPHVSMVITATSGINLTDMGCQAWAVSATGFSAQVANASGGAGSANVDWIAVTAG